MSLAIAREILSRRPERHVLLVQRSSAPQPSASTSRTSIVHSGSLYEPESQAAR